MIHDVLIIGGSFAGLAAAMPLSRARRKVLLVDAAQPRNRFATASHGFLGQDGVAPAEIMARGRQELAAYPTFRMREGLVEKVEGEIDDFSITLADGRQERGRRLILATGISDELPSIPGLRPRWGQTVVHCPYCHGYELAGRPLGVLASGPGSDMKALLVADWGPATLFTQAAFQPEPEMANRLKARGVTVEESPIVELLGPEPALEAARLADGRVIALGGLFVAPRTHMASPFALHLGCRLTDGMTGPHIEVDNWKKTSVPGVYAAGDAAAPMHSAPLAVAAGMLAGVGAHQSLL